MTSERISFPSDLVGHSVDAGPSVVDGELGGVVSLPDHVQVALVVPVSFPGHTDQRLTAADDHRLVLSVDPGQNLRHKDTSVLGTWTQEVCSGYKVVKD